MRRPAALPALCLAAVVVLTGCGGGSSSKGTPAASPTSQPASTTTVQAAPGELPIYQPSRLISQASGSTVVRSPDSVAKVGAFYADALAKGGWKIISSSRSAYSANFTARRGTQGTTIAISSISGSGSVISISTYRV
jgi:hypothetical protein